jgi:imidazolonepropionase-like amidohydrolase
MKVILLLLIFLCGFEKIFAQDQILFKAKKVQSAPGQSYEPGELLIQGPKILAIGKKLSVPKKCKVVDWTKYEIYPGLISPGSSLGLAEINSLRSTRDEREVGTHTPEIEAWTAINPDSELIPVARANGITHSVIIPLGGSISGTSGTIALDGWGIEDMIVQKKVALHVWWPGQSLSLSAKKNSSKSINDQENERKKSIREITEYFEQAELYLQLKKNNKAKLSYNPSWEAMIPFVSRKLPIMVHAEETRQIASAIDWATKQKYRIIISGGRDAWKIADKLASSRVPVVFRHVFTAPNHINKPFDNHFRAPGVLANAGVDLSIGLRLGAWSAANQRNLPYHAAHGIPFGLSHNQALASITINPAKLIGLDHRLGSLERGKDATFIACSGDIFDLRTNVAEMRILGKKVNLTSRHTRLFEKYKRRPKIKE